MKSFSLFDVCFVCVDVCVSVDRYTAAIACQWRSEDQRESVLSSPCGAPRGQTWGSRLGSRRIICRAILPALRNVLTVHRFTSFFVWTELLQTACSDHAFVAAAFCFFPALSGTFSGFFNTSVKVISSGTFLRTLYVSGSRLLLSSSVSRVPGWHMLQLSFHVS